MNGKRRDTLIAAAMFLAAVALALPFRTQFPYHWDSGEFTLAIRQYDVRLSQPHAPGYFLYVMLGRLVNFFVGDAHASLVWLSVLAGGGLAATLYLLGTALFDRRTGAIAGLLSMTSPIVWFHSCVALTYVVDGFLVCVTALVCWRAMQRGGTWCDAVLIGALLAVLGGIRQQSVPAVGLMVLYTFWRFQQQRLAKLAVAMMVALALGLAWFVPMVQMSGGLPVYMKIVRLHTAYNAPATLAGGGLDALIWNILFVGIFCANGLMLASVALFVALLYRARRMDPDRKRQWDSEHARALQLLAIWLSSMLILATFVGFTKQPGYVMNFLPALMLLAAAALAGYPKLAALVCAFNIFTFVAWPPSWDGVLFHVGRTARLLREHHEKTFETITTIRRYSPTEACVLHVSDMVFSPRQFQVLLPEYDQYQLVFDTAMLSPPDKPMIAIRGGQLGFDAPDGWRNKPLALLLVPPGMTLQMFEPYLDVRKAERVSETVYCLRTAKAAKP